MQITQRKPLELTDIQPTYRGVKISQQPAHPPSTLISAPASLNAGNSI